MFKKKAKKEEDEEAPKKEVQNESEDEASDDDKIRSKKFYIGMIFVSIITCIIFRIPMVSKNLLNLYSFKNCDGNEVCLGNQCVYRISFGAFIFFLMMGIATYVPSTDAAAIHMDWWIFKILGFPALIGLGFLIPNGFFTIYAEIARVISGFFLLLQILILVDFAYDLHEHLTHEGDEDEMAGLEKCMYLGLSGTFFFSWPYRMYSVICILSKLSNEYCFHYNITHYGTSSCMPFW